MALTLKTVLGIYDDVEGDSYVSADAADEFHADRGNTDWADASATVREQKLRLATDWLDMIYDWRADLNYVPEAVKRATIMLAREALTVTLSETREATRTIRTRTRIEGAVDKETVYADTLQSRFPAIHALLAPYGSAAVGSIRTARAVRA